MNAIGLNINKKVSRTTVHGISIASRKAQQLTPHVHGKRQTSLSDCFLFLAATLPHEEVYYG